MFKSLNKKQKAFLLVILASVLGGSVPVAAKYAMAVFKPFTVLVLRFFFATLSLMPIMIRQKQLSFKRFKQVFSVSFIGAFDPIFLFLALQFTRASFSSLIYAIIPALTALMFVL